MNGRTIALYGDTGAGKTAQAGEYAKWVYKTRKKRTLLYTSDLGGYDTIAHLVRAKIITVIPLGQTDDPWIWVNEAVSGKQTTDDIGLVIYDSGTSQAEALLSSAAKSDVQIGQRPNQKFVVAGRGSGEVLKVGNNTDAHYGVVQIFMLDAIWKSTWLTTKGIDVIWTFSTHRSEEQDRTPVIGPKLAGKALTASIPKWFNYTFRLVSVPQDGMSPIHRLFLSEHAELAGMGHSFGNVRTPLDAGEALPPFIEPASIIEAITLIEQAQQAADAKLAEELGL